MRKYETRTGVPATAIKIGITIIAVAFILIHILRPGLKVDAVTIALLAIATIPWFYSVIESAKLPGGYEIKFRDFETAGEPFGSLLDDGTSTGDDGTPANSTLSTLKKVQSIDANLAVASLRIEIEKSIRRIADANGVASRGPLTTLVRTLGEKGFLPPLIVDGTKSLIQLGNEAVHGATVDPEAAEWALNFGDHVITSLNRLAP